MGSTEGEGWHINYRTQGGDELPWLIVKKSDTLQSIGLTGWGLYAARAFAKREVITVYVGEDIGQAGSTEAAAHMDEL